MVRLVRKSWARSLPRRPLPGLALLVVTPLVATLLVALGTSSADGRSRTELATAPTGERMSTPEHLRVESWWPTKPAVSREAYAGSAQCAECHRSMAATQATSQMAHTLMRAGKTPVVQGHARLEYAAGDFHYLLERAGEDLTMTVARGAEKRTAVMEWAFGSGDVGQSYTWATNGSKGGQLMETRFNYFATMHGLAGTPGRLAGAPVSMAMAVGRPLEEFEAKTCFACHTTALFPGAVTDARNIVPGVGCEACHGPGAQHVRLMEARRREGATKTETPEELAIVNSARLSPTKAVEMCGACHSTPWDVKLMGAAGEQTVRFPAYRLEKSRCWGTAGDERLKCAGCHDPHAPLERELAAYDGTCLSCHAVKGARASVEAAKLQDAQEHVGAACPVATSRCASCHMPKVEVPEMHDRFTDHNIRVVRAGERFPD